MVKLPKILFVASECKPFAKVGGLGDVIGDLPKFLEELGMKVQIIMPLYEQIDGKRWQLRSVVQNFPVGDEKINLYKTNLPGSTVEVFFIDNKKYIGRGPVYFQKTAFVGTRKEIDRFLFFSKSVFELLSKGNQLSPDIIHCNDWHTGALVTLLKGKRFKTVFTIHNLANQGKFNNRNLIAEGINNADMVSTVSETYAKEILTKKFGAGLEKILIKKAKQERVVGILNGIDYQFWPVQAKKKVAFQKKNGLRANKAAPIFGLVARLTSQKGISFVIPNVAKFVRQFGAQFVFLGTGQKNFEDGLKNLAKKYPKSVYSKIAFDEKSAHDIYAQSDFFLMPSRFEPSGLGQMIAMHFGTPPIVRATGGLKDSVKNLETGFVFKKESSKALAEAMLEAVKFYSDQEKMNKLIENCRKADFSWTKSAKSYLKIYKKIL